MLGFMFLNACKDAWKFFLFTIIQKLIMDNMHKYAYVGITFTST